MRPMAHAVRGTTRAAHSISSPNLKQTGSALSAGRRRRRRGKKRQGLRFGGASRRGEEKRSPPEEEGCRCGLRCSMSSLGTSKGILEVAKFGVYVSVPVALTYLVATDSKTLKKLMGLVRPCPFYFLPSPALPP